MKVVGIIIAVASDGYVSFSLQLLLLLPLPPFQHPTSNIQQHHPLHGDAARTPWILILALSGETLEMADSNTYFFRGKMDNGKANELACSETVPIGTRDTRKNTWAAPKGVPRHNLTTNPQSLWSPHSDRPRSQRGNDYPPHLVT